MGVLSDGSHYGIPKGICYSLPLTCKSGKWTVVQGLKIDEFSQKKIDASLKELQ
jgi:malate dehydrogenase